MSTSKKVLILTYYWPPAGGSGVQRWLYFAKLLKDLGWTPYVVTVDERHASYPVLDHSLEVETNGIRVFKTKTRELLKSYSLLTTGSRKKGIPQGEVRKTGWLSKFAAFVRGNFFIPDARKGWNPYAAIKAMEIIKNEGITTVITTGPPHSTHLIGMLFKAGLQVNWLADFRDPWTDIFYNQQLYRTPWAKKTDRKLEKQVLQNADAILTTVAGALHKKLMEKAPRQKFYALPNGYDADLMKSIPRTQTKFFHIIYTGLLTHNQDYSVVIKAIQLLTISNPKQKIQLSLAGQIAEDILEQIQETLPNVQVKPLGYLSHKEAIALMKSGDLLLNFIFKGAASQMISGKLLEYMATGVPILSLGDPNSEAGQLLAKGSHSKMFTADDHDEITDFIKQIRIQKGQVNNTFPQLEDWSRQAITKELVNVLETLKARPRR